MATKKTAGKKTAAKKTAAKKTAAKKTAAKKTATTEPAQRFCSLCGALGQAGPSGLPPGWSFETNERGLVYQCGECVRRNIRAIEGRLPQEWWE